MKVLVKKFFTVLFSALLLINLLQQSLLADTGENKVLLLLKTENNGAAAYREVYLNETGNVCSSATLSNNENIAKTAMLFTALYDGDNNLLDIRAKTQKINPGESGVNLKTDTITFDREHILKGFLIYDNMKVSSEAKLDFRFDGSFPIQVSLFGNLLNLSKNPVKNGSEIYIPFCEIFSAFGMECTEDKNSVTANSADKNIKVVNESTVAKINESNVTLSSPAKVLNGVIMVPYSFIADATDTDVFIKKFGSNRKRIVISPKATEELLTAIKNFDDTLYSEKLIDWILGLYDSESGGFYFKTNAKYTEGFYPDRESTAKHLGSVANMLGISTSDIIKEYTPEMRAKLLNFAQMYQSDEDGYWYEAPWGKYVGESKRLYETSAASQLCSLAGGRPLYLTPEERLAQGKVSLLSASLDDNKFSSKEAFKAWFDSLTWDTSLYGAGSLLLSNMGQIRSAGYFEYAVELISERIDPETGMLGHLNTKTGKFDTHEVSQDAMSGTYKIASYWGESRYESMKGKDLIYPYYDKLLDSVISIILSDNVEYTNACHISNAISLLSSATFHQSYISYENYQKFINSIPALINKTLEKSKRHQTSDGSYTYSPGQGAGGNQGTVHAFCLADGETSGSSMMLALRSNMYILISREMPPLFDGKITAKDFVDKLKAVEPTEKIKYQVQAEYSFDNLSLGALPQNIGFRHTGDITVCAHGSGKALKIETDGSGERPVIIADVGTKNGRGFVCEFDIKLECDTYGNGILNFEFGSWPLSTVTYINKQSYGYAFANGRYADWSDYRRIKIEYDVANGVGTNKYYVDNELVYSGPHYSNGYGDMPATENISALQIRAGTDNAFTAYIDDFSFVQK